MTYIVMLSQIDNLRIGERPLVELESGIRDVACTETRKGYRRPCLSLPHPYLRGMIVVGDGYISLLDGTSRMYRLEVDLILSSVRHTQSVSALVEERNL